MTLHSELISDVLAFECLDEKAVSDKLLADYSAVMEPGVGAGLETRLSTPNAKWRVVSGFQKAVRFGSVDHALRCVNALVSGGEEKYLMRRMAVTALEDIGLADPVLAATVLAAVRNKKWRDANGGDARVLMNLARDMAATKKSRLACHISVAAGYSPNSLPLKQSVAAMLPEQWLDLYTDPGSDMEARMVAGWCLDGSLKYVDENGEEKYVARAKKEMLAAFDKLGLPCLLKAVGDWAARLGIEGLGVATGLAWTVWFNGGEEATIHANEVDEPEPVVRGMLSAAYDMHTQEGKRSFAYFSKSCPEISELAEKYGANKLGYIGNLVFILEGSRLRNDVYGYGAAEYWAQQSYLAQMEAAGVAPELAEKALAEGLPCLLANMDKLHHARRRIMESWK
jgi:hypothetical protein